MLGKNGPPLLLLPPPPALQKTDGTVGITGTPALAVEKQDTWWYTLAALAVALLAVESKEQLEESRSDGRCVDDDGELAAAAGAVGSMKVAMFGRVFFVPKVFVPMVFWNTRATTHSSYTCMDQKNNQK